MDEQQQPPKCPPPVLADVATCTAAAEEFFVKVTAGAKTAAQAYRNAAYAMGLMQPRVAKLAEAARQERIALALAKANDRANVKGKAVPPVNHVEVEQ